MRDMHGNSLKWTKEDEDQWLEQVKREHAISSDIIQQLRAHVRLLLTNQKRLITNLMQAQTDLNMYRAGVLARTERLLKSDAISGFYWDDVDGWHRDSDRGTVNGQ